MGLNVNSLNTAIDSQALARVREQILNPVNASEKTVDVSKFDFSKFNRASLGTDFYAPRTNGDVALQASKAVTDFGVKLSGEFGMNVQYLNSRAAQSLLGAQELGQKVISVDAANQYANEKNLIVTTTQTTETQDLNKDRRGENPFSFYFQTEGNDADENETASAPINIFA